MEKREDENPDYHPDATGNPQAAPANADPEREAQMSDSAHTPTSADKEPKEPDKDPDTAGTTDSDNNQPFSDNDNTGTDSNAGTGGWSDGESEGGDRENRENGEEEPDKGDDKTPEEKPRFEERFLTSATSTDGTKEERQRESLATSLIRAALSLLTGEIPEDSFIPLMEAAIAREAIQAARAEGEIAGRNAVIEEQLITPPVGAPDLNGTPIAQSRRPATSIFDLADLAR